jgi:hypothetical protein
MNRFALALALASLAPTAAHAYLIDLNDARVVEMGAFEAELQPIGYYQLLAGGEDHEIVAPSSQIYFGFAEGWDFIFLTRGFVLLDDLPEQSDYVLAQQMVGVRAMIVHGAYSDEGLEGPSLTAQFAVLLPDIGGPGRTGVNAALLFAQQWDFATLHLNVWVNTSSDRPLNLFFAAAIEGPIAWDVRPTIEVWLDVTLDGEPQISSLLGAVIDLNDEVALEAGVRMGGWEGWMDLEVRASVWWYWKLWEPG